MMKHFKLNGLSLLVSAAVLTLAGCGGGESAAPANKNYAVSVLADASGNPVTTVAVNVDTLAPASGTDTWQTPQAKMLGITLLAQLDSSGPDVWDASKHPLVYMTAQGTGYAGTISPTQTAPGLAIIDANTYASVASAQYKAAGVVDGSYSENHGLGVSPDGKWIYTQGNMPTSMSDLAGGAVLLVINARTLKIDKIIKSRVHHVRTIHDANTNKDLVLVDGWGTFFAMDPSNDNKVVAAVNPANLNAAGYLGFADPDGKYLFITTRDGFAGSDGGVSIVSLKDWLVKARINTGDPAPIAVTFSGDNKIAYVTGGENSTVAKIDKSSASISDWKFVGIANAGGIGPYGINMNWDDKRIFAISKGEASHNLGFSMGIMDTSKFADPAKYIGWGTVMGDLYTGCLRGDHAIVHPDPVKNEMWISCNSSFNNAVVGMGNSALNTGTGGAAVKLMIAQPNGGSSHNGAFVQYIVSGATWNGQVLSDTNGLHGAAVQSKLDVLAGKIVPGVAATTTTTAAVTTTTAGTATTTTSVATTTTTTAASGASLDGKALFNDPRYCIQCHTPAARAGRTAQQIKDAIAGVPAMGFLSVLTDAQIAAIAEYLAHPDHF